MARLTCIHPELIAACAREREEATVAAQARWSASSLDALLGERVRLDGKHPGCLTPVGRAWLRSTRAVIQEFIDQHTAPAEETG